MKMARKTATKLDAPKKPRKKYTRQPGANPPGNKSKYDAKKVDAILARHGEGESLTSLCKEHAIPFGTFMGWIYDNRENVAERYSRAQFANAAANVNYAFEIADDGRNDFVDRTTKSGDTITVPNREAIQRSDLRVKFRQWYAEKVFSGALRYKPAASSESDSSTAAIAAVEALERLAAEKASTANHRKAA